MCRTRALANHGGMDFNGLSLVYIPVAVAFVTFVIYGGLVMPAKEMRDSLSPRHRRPRGPDGRTDPIGLRADHPEPTGRPEPIDRPEAIDRPEIIDRTDRKAAA